MIRPLVLAALLLPSLAGGADLAGPASRVPRGVKDEARAKKEIQELFLGFDDAGENGDADAAAALLDFPLLVATDGAKGEASGAPWTRERWLETMAPVYDVPLKNARISHKAQVFLVSDALATVNLITTVTKGGKSTVERTAAIVIRRDGEWRIKARVESGWSDVAPVAAEPQPDDEPAGKTGAKPAAAKDGASEPADAPKEPGEKDDAEAR